MLNALKEEANYTRTENGALTYASTQSDVLDFFSTAGALRHASEEEIRTRFLKAYAENADLAMKSLFFARDIRGGLGERRLFRILLQHLAQNEPASLRRNLNLIAEYGRFDDLLSLLGTACETDALALIRAQFEKDLAAMAKGEPVSLLAKWLPSVNTSDKEVVYRAKKIARALGLSHAEYRKALSALRRKIDITENHLRERAYDFDYENLPSKAALKYRKAFLRNDTVRYQNFLQEVEAGRAVMHTGTLYPYDIVQKVVEVYEGYRYCGEIIDMELMTEEERRALDVTWNALEDFTGEDNSLVVVDGSGSMYGWENPMPAAVALSLGIYFAEHNTGAFHNHFITFSEDPRLVEIKGRDICEKVAYCEQFNEVANTNIQVVFELILSAAINHNLPQEELPKTLYIISDMEFDCCADDADVTNFEHAKELFGEFGYELPQVVFWNVASRALQQPVTMNEQGVALVSGCTPRIFDMLKSGILNPYAAMLEILESERYAPVAA